MTTDIFKVTDKFNQDYYFKVSNISFIFADDIKNLLYVNDWSIECNNNDEVLTIFGNFYQKYKILYYYMNSTSGLSEALIKLDNLTNFIETIIRRLDGEIQNSMRLTFLFPKEECYQFLPFDDKDTLKKESAKLAAAWAAL